MIEFIEFNGRKYPAFQAEGNASQFAIPFAKKLCSGFGVDIGFGKPEWKFPEAIGADINDTTNEYHAGFLPRSLDYIYSSHCLEHLQDWVASLEYWVGCLKTKGVLFLYLPHRSQEYWKPWHNRKHLHVLDPELVCECLEAFGLSNVTYSGVDLNNSFMIFGTKK